MPAHTHLCTHAQNPQPSSQRSVRSSYPCWPVCPAPASLWALGRSWWAGQSRQPACPSVLPSSRRLADVHMQSAHLHVRRPHEGPAPRGVLPTAAPAPLALPSAPRPRWPPPSLFQCLIVDNTLLVFSKYKAYCNVNYTPNFFVITR